VANSHLRPAPVTPLCTRAATRGRGAPRAGHPPRRDHPGIPAPSTPAELPPRGVVRVPRRVFQSLLPERPTPERCVEAYYLQRTRFERIAERKLRRCRLAEDGNVEITGRDLHEGSAANARGNRTIPGRLSRG
jgi:hypothetical protein